MSRANVWSNWVRIENLENCITDLVDERRKMYKQFDVLNEQVKELQEMHK